MISLYTVRQSRADQTYVRVNETFSWIAELTLLEKVCPLSSSLILHWTRSFLMTNLRQLTSENVFWTNDAEVRNGFPR